MLGILEVPVLAFYHLSEQLDLFPLFWVFQGMISQVSDNRVFLDALGFRLDLGVRAAACWLDVTRRYR